MLKFVILVSCTAALALGATLGNGGPHHPHPIGQDTAVTSKRQEPIFCEACELLVKWTETQLTANTTEQEIEKFLENDVCALLPSQLAEACKQLVENDLKTLIQELVNKEDPKTVCKQLGVCSQKVIRKRQEPVLCPICQFLVEKIEEGLAKNSTEEQIEKDLEDVCSLLPGTLADECKQAVQKYAPQIIDMLIKKEDPKTVCTQLGICTGKAAKKRQEPLFCEACKLLFKELENFISENSTEKDIEQALEKVCDLLPSGTAQECKQVIENFAPEIINMLIAKVPPNTICSQLGICQQKVIRKRQSFFCQLCEAVTGLAESFLQKNATEQEIEQFLENDVCSLLPSSLANDCDQFVEQNLADLIKMLVNREDPKKICSQLGLCQGKVIKKRQSGLCEGCELIIGFFESFIQKNTTEQEIAQLLENDVCSLLPSSLADACKQVVEQDLPGLINMLVNREDLKKICSQLGLCQGKVATKRKAGPFCVICEFAMKELENLLQKNSTEQDIEKALEKICGLLPDTIKNECDAFVQKYAPQIINLLINKADPKEICTLLTLCSSEDRQVQTIQ